MAPNVEPDPDEDIDRIVAARTGDLPLREEEYRPMTKLPYKPVANVPAKAVQPQTASPEPVKTVEPLMSGFRTLPDGSLRGVITISVENSELLRTWAEGAGTDLTEYINEHVNEALMAYAASTSEA